MFSDKTFDVDASYQGDKVKVIEFEAAFENAPIKVEISKTDITGKKELPGAKLSVIDADGSNLGIYRKTHIPDDHYYQEKFYFTPGNTGFKVFNTRFGNIGIGICWDQWFPETARGMSVQGAEILFYPTAIGSEPILEVDSMPHWRRCMQGHAASNLNPVFAANRIGEETVEPCPENGMQKSTLNFYGSSFITDNTGALCAELPGGEEGVLVSTFDLDALKADRLNWGLFRARRPEMYAKIVGK